MNKMRLLFTLCLAIIIISITGCADTMSPSSSLTTDSSGTDPLAVITATQKELGSNLFYGTYSIGSDTLVALERDYADYTRQYFVTIDLKTGSKTRLSVDLSDRIINKPPSIYMNKIVWSSVSKDEWVERMLSSTIQPAPNYDIFLFDLKTGQLQQLTTDEHAQINPVFQGSTVVWLDARYAGTNNPMYDVFLYERTTGKEIRVTKNPTAAGSLGASLFGIVWTDVRNADPQVKSHAENDPDYNCDIYWYDRPAGTERRITTYPGNDRNPVVDGKSIVWLRQLTYRSANVFLYDLNTGNETQISQSGYAAYTPSISGRNIVWEDARVTGGNTSNDVLWNGQPPCTDIYLYDLDSGLETLLTKSEPNKVWTDPVIHGDYVVTTWSRQVGPVVYVTDISKSGPVGKTRDNPVPLNYTVYKELGFMVAGEGPAAETEFELAIKTLRVARGNAAFELLKKTEPAVAAAPPGEEYIAIELQVACVETATPISEPWRAMFRYGLQFGIAANEDDASFSWQRAPVTPLPALQDFIKINEVIEGWLVYCVPSSAQKPLLYCSGGLEYWFALE